MSRAVRLEALFQSLVTHFGEEEHMDLDYFDFTEIAEKHGLIKWVPYDPKKHGEMDVEKGEKIWVTVGQRKRGIR